MSMDEPIADLAEKELNQLEESGTEEELDELNTSLERDRPGRDESQVWIRHNFLNSFYT